MLSHGGLRGSGAVGVLTLSEVGVFLLSLLIVYAAKKSVAAVCCHDGSGIDAVGGSSFHTRRENRARQLAVSVVFIEASGQRPRADEVSAKEAGSFGV